MEGQSEKGKLSVRVEWTWTASKSRSSYKNVRPPRKALDFYVSEKDDQQFASTVSAKDIYFTFLKLGLQFTNFIEQGSKLYDLLGNIEYNFP